MEKLVLPSLRGVLGDWVYYSSLMSARDINERVKAAKDIRESKTLDEFLQRDLKERKKEIANYLLKREDRFFNSIIIGVFDDVPDWFEFNIQSNEHFRLSDEQLAPIKESIGFLVFSGKEKMFAIDGQHRVAGITIAAQQDESRPEDEQKLKDDQFSVIFIAHLDDIEGRKRTRRLFSDINKNAKPVSEGDKIKIDERDLSSIVTRRVYAEYPQFKRGTLISLTETAKLDTNDDKFFTNLLSLNNVHKKLSALIKKSSGTETWDEVNVKNLQAVAFGFYDFIFENVIEYKLYFSGKLTLKLARTDNKYLLFRPVGLILLAKLYVFFAKKKRLEVLKKYINKIGFVFPNSPYNKVLWDNGKMEAKLSSQTIAYNLSLYLLGEYPDGDLKGLIQKYKGITKDEKAILPKKIL
ncbi:DNA sulfur modification protein DndB [Pedobacter sp. 22163]|uniref:DNA sulfur modification protein DndB n=1 Tax=Pedobacter sp. 22163 TaxID=3453883 RepID=UPI003F8694EF